MERVTQKRSSEAWMVQFRNYGGKQAWPSRNSFDQNQGWLHQGAICSSLPCPKSAGIKAPGSAMKLPSSAVPRKEKCSEAAAENDSRRASQCQQGGRSPPASGPAAANSPGGSAAALCSAAVPLRATGEYIFIYPVMALRLDRGPSSGSRQQSTRTPGAPRPVLQGGQSAAHAKASRGAKVDSHRSYVL